MKTSVFSGISKVALLFSMTMLLASPLEAKTEKDDKKGTETTAQKDTTAKKKKDPYEKLLKGAVTASGDFVTLHKNAGKVYLEYPVKHLGRRVLMGGTTSATSNPTYISLGYKHKDPLCLLVDKRDSVLTFSFPNSAATLNSEESGMKEAFEKSFMPSLYKQFPILAYSKDSTSVVVDFSSMVYDLGAGGSNIEPLKKGSTEDKETSYFGEIKAFEDNASIQLHQKVNITQIIIIFKIKVGEATTMTNISMKLLPEDKMAPRVQDSRVGVFWTAENNIRKYEMSQLEDGFRPYLLANRWRVEPTDVEAWKAGELVTVKKPIVWYVDNGFPQEWKEPISKGVLIWNQAFEKIGLKDVMQVRPFPTKEEDPEFDPDNLKYSCIRYSPSMTQNAMGPSWTDPLTGEIVNASVIVYNDIIKLINNWRLVHTAQIDPRVRTKKMPKDVVDESLTYVIAHEIGHTLGLMHNMAASASVPVDSLRSATYTQKYGTTTSIMDYARFNYVAQPEDKGVRLTPPDLGIYDEYVIKWLYTPVPDAKDMWEEAAIASKIIDEKAGDPRFRYGRQQLRIIYDPSAMSEDLGDDPIKAGNYAISNLKYILANVDSWIEGDDDTRLKQGVYDQIANQYYRYLNNVMYQIGGIYLSEVKAGEGMPSVAVDKETQKESLVWLMDQLRDCAWIDGLEMTNKFPLHVNYSNIIARLVAGNLTSTVPQNVVLAAHITEDSQKYSIADYYDDLYNEVFKSTIKNRALTEEEKLIQTNIISALSKPMVAARNVSKFSEDVLPLTTLDYSHLPSLDELIFTGQISQEMMNEHGDKFRAIENQYGKGSIASSIVTESFGEDRAPFISKVSITSIDDSVVYAEKMIGKINKLVKSKAKSGPAADRAHYAYLLRATSLAVNE